LHLNNVYHFAFSKKIVPLQFLCAEMNDKCTININDFALCRTITIALDDTFFEIYMHPDVLGGNVTAEITLLAAQSTLDISLKGTARVVCDRCLESFDTPITFDGMARICKARTIIDHDMHNSDDDTITMDDEGFIDLSQYLYESICLSVPLQKLHPVDNEGNSKCNQQMLTKLRELNCNL
jgi:uncharacterized metal-binding protein YceD (DUF177 family)